METAIVIAILLSLLGVLLKTRGRIADAFNQVLSQRRVTVMLLAFAVLGFLSTLENSTMAGCVFFGESIFSLESIVLSSISITLILIILKSKNKHWQQIAFISEFVLWVLKLFFFKGGYMVGFEGTPAPLMVVYDATSIAIRLLLLNYLFQSINLDVVKILVISTMMVGCKIMFFKYPLYSQLEDHYSQQKTEEIRNDIIGDWSGTVLTITEKEEVKKLIRNDTIGDRIIIVPIENNTLKQDTTLQTVQLKINSDSIYFYNTENLGSAYQFVLDGENWGYIYSDQDSLHSNLELFLEKHTQDSLRFELSDHFSFWYKFEVYRAK